MIGVELNPLRWKIVAVAAFILAVYGIGHHQGENSVQAAWDASKAQIAAAEKAAILARLADNAKLAQQQAADNAAITKAHDEELTDVRARLAAAGRMRQPAFCRPAAAPTEAASASVSDATSPASGLLPDAVADDIQALILQTEEVASTARTCQSFIKANGLAP